MLFDIKYLNHLKDRLDELKQLTKREVPDELSSVFDYKAMKQVLHSVWNTPVKHRPFTPMIKQMAPSQIITLSMPLSLPEKKYIKDLAHVIHKSYGAPVFQYKANDAKHNLNVKQWQSLLLVSPKVTAHASIRRFENFQKYLQPSKFSPDFKTLSESIQVVLHHLNMPKFQTNFEPKYVSGLFAAHSSNVGFPFYANEMRVVNNQTYRDHTVEWTKRLNAKYGASWMATVPATIIGRDQPAGLDMAIPNNISFEELLHRLDDARYKPSKARPVFAISRIVNNNIAPIIHGIIHQPHFLNTPEFCGFRDRNDRLSYYKRFDDMANELGLIPVNVDFASFDASISPEMMMIAHDIIFDWVELKHAPDKLKESVMASAIYTKYFIQNPANGKILYGMKNANIPSGISTTGLSGFIIAAIVITYALIKVYGKSYINSLFNAARSKQTFAWAGLGDDFMTLIRNLSDLKQIAKICERDFGMSISVDSYKTAVGVDFLQEHYFEGKVYYPLGRVWRSLLYTERPKGLGPYQWTMTYFNILNNIRDNTQDDKRLTQYQIIKYDRSRLGRANVKTQASISIPEFMGLLKQELLQQGLTAKQALWDGDPSKEDLYSENGHIRSEYVKQAFSSSEQAYNDWLTKHEQTHGGD